ncbi:MAG: DUF5719 family protein [Arachnia propionica]|uniref:DUF5719 family protein n=1 Tax=Arachnia propionica TaxID=1750 RepID=UPI0026F92513|nr:DUF5719 family protein [Arachnia propionica]
MNRILQTLGGFVVLAALLFAVTLLTPAELPRVTTVETTRSTKVVCIPAGEGATVLVTKADSVGALGEASTAEQQVVLPGQSAPVVAEGTAGPFGTVMTGTDDVRTLTPCIRPVSRGVISLPATANTELRIVNPDSSDAAIDLTLHGPEGEIQALGARGIALGPNGEKTIALSVLTSEATPVGVSFQASRGRAAVVAFTTTATSGTAAIPAEAATTHWLPGVMAGVPEVSVVLANPGADRATVRLTAYGATPAFTPEGGDAISIAGRSTVVVPLQGSLAGEAAALRVDSDVEVLAGLAVAQGDGAQLSPVKAGTELTTFVPPGGTLQLTNPGDEPVTANVTIASEEGETTETLEIAAGTTAAQPLPQISDGGQVVTIQAPAELFGAVVATGEAGTWAAPLQRVGASDTAPVEAELDPGLH